MLDKLMFVEISSVVKEGKTKPWAPQHLLVFRSLVLNHTHHSFTLEVALGARFEARVSAQMLLVLPRFPKRLVAYVASIRHDASRQLRSWSHYCSDIFGA